MNTPREGNFPAETPLSEVLEDINAHLAIKGLPDLTAEDLDCLGRSQNFLPIKTIGDIVKYGYATDVVIITAVFLETEAPISKTMKGRKLEIVIYELRRFVQGLLKS